MRRLLQFIVTRPRGEGESHANAAHLSDTVVIGPAVAALLAVVLTRIERSFERVHVLMQADMDLMLAA